MLQITFILFLIIIIGVLFWVRKLSKLNKELIVRQKELENINHQLNLKNSKNKKILETADTQSKQLENSYLQLEQQKNQFENIFNNTPIPILIVSKESHKILFANESASVTYKMPKDKLINSDINILYTRETQREDIIQATAKDGSLYNYRTRYILQDGSRINALLSIIPINYNGVASNLGVISDITPLIEYQVKLKKAEQKALIATKSKSEFLANMSHEIRTPMNAVIGFADLLSHLIKDPIQKDYLYSIQTGGKALLTIINDILDLSKIEAGKFQIDKEVTNPKKLFLEMNTIFHSKINQKNLIFNIEIDETLPKAIIIDNVRIRQILINLIGNAIKFTENGTITLKITSIIKNNIENQIDLQIEVIDTGRGIPKQYQKSIFGAFEQTNKNDATTFGGTGLGLAICSKLSKLMNGSIDVQSEVNKGTTFAVMLKDIEVSLLETLDCNEQNNEDILFKKAKILVVDDVATNRKLVHSLLLNTQLDIIEAVNGQEAIDVIEKSNDIDLVLMDLRMPIMNGYQSTAKIKEIEDKKHIPIIAFTASVMDDELKKVEKIGFNGYLRKPIVYKDLENTLKKYLKYKIIENNKLDILTISLSDEAKANIQKTLDKLNGVLSDELINIKDKGDFSLIKSFAIKLKDLGKDNLLDIIVNYANNILIAIESFDIDTVNNLLNGYKNISDKLENLK
ncbi:MAG: hypothetical protein DRG78_07280 [Epsilonproteobacteria bacterium]|nr:MAG: hypothetical protein DRG78_07280 [Campylobacterota bacterium]